MLVSYQYADQGHSIHLGENVQVTMILPTSQQIFCLQILVPRSDLLEALFPLLPGLSKIELLCLPLYCYKKGTSRYLFADGRFFDQLFFHQASKDKDTTCPGSG